MIRLLFGDRSHLVWPDSAFSNPTRQKFNFCGWNSVLIRRHFEISIEMLHHIDQIAFVWSARHESGQAGVTSTQHVGSKIETQP